MKFRYQPPLDMILKSNKGASKIYQTLLDHSFESKGRDKWVVLTGIDKEQWLGSFSFLKITTKDTKLRWLQFRILHHILTTNRSVSKFKENQTHLCQFCNNSSETIQHLFWTCDLVKKFWNELISLINIRCKHSHQFKVNEKLVLFGQSEFLFTDNVCDLIILMAKLFIYKCKVQGRTLNTRSFINEIYTRYCVEKINSRNSIQFINRWNPYLDLFKSLIVITECISR